jgi:hypothetical protein
MSSLCRERVVDRWLRKADSIGDPVRLIGGFGAVVHTLGVHEKDVPWMLEAEKMRDAFNTPGVSWEGLEDKVVEARKLIKELDAETYRLAAQVSFSSRLFQQVRAQELFLSLLQQFQLTPQIRKTIESAAKYHGSRRKTPPKEEALGAYIKMMATVRGQLAAARQAIVQGVKHDAEGAQEVLKAGGFRVINTGGFDSKVMQEVQAVVAQADKLLRAKGLGRVCYGDVLVSRTLSKPSILAFYLVSSDEMFVRANLRGKQHDAVATLCHELGHRLFYKFLKTKAQDIKDIYRQISGKTDKRKALDNVLRDHPVLPGDTIVAKSVVYEVTGTGFGSGGLEVKLRRKDDPTLKATVGLEAYFKIKGLLTHSDLSSFVSSYASTDWEENFSEMVAHWCLDKLPEDQIQLLESVL